MGPPACGRFGLRGEDSWGGSCVSNPLKIVVTEGKEKYCLLRCLGSQPFPLMRWQGRASLSFGLTVWGEGIMLAAGATDCGCELSHQAPDMHRDDNSFEPRGEDENVLAKRHCWWVLRGW